MAILNYYAPRKGNWRFLTMATSSIAKKVIKETLQVKEDEQVLIQTWSHTQDLSNALALETYQAGATPIMLLSTDQLFLDYVTKVPEEYYVKHPRAMLSLIDNIDAQIFLFGPKDPKILKAASGERISKAFEADKPVMDKANQRKIRTAFLPVGYITEERAKNYGFDLANWRKNFDQALEADMEKVSVLGKKVAQQLQNAKQVQVSDDQGTSLTFSLGNRPVHIRDGILDQEDLSKGNYTESLPSGTVTVAPLETSAEGTVSFDRASALMGKMVRGLRLVFQKGRVTSFDGKDNLDAFSGMYMGASGEKGRIASFTIGLNPNAKYMGLPNHDELVLGGVSIAIGANKDIGGTNNTTFGYGQSLTNATVKVDGKPLVSNGKIQV
jgi:leucyl aminopeptidase (aminopeptidase T)